MFRKADYGGKPDNKTNVYRLTKAQQRYSCVKRGLDILVAAAAIVLLAIPMLLIALVHKLLNPREPVFFLQKRVGRNGEWFTLIKFTTMRRDVPRYMAAKDLADREAYVTGYGRFLRSTSLDELPQLFQVLSGKMSLIGPRPLIPQEGFIHVLRRDAGVYQLRPGMTGWAQVNGRDRLTDETKAAYDREYLERMSFSMDCRIFWITIKKVLCREGVDILGRL